MIGKDQLDRIATRVDRTLRMGEDFHVFRDRIHASRPQGTDVFDFDRTDTARTAVGDAFEITEGRDTDAGVFRRIQDRCAGFGLNADPVDFQMDFAHGSS